MYHRDDNTCMLKLFILFCLYGVVYIILFVWCCLYYFVCMVLFILFCLYGVVSCFF